MRYIGPRERRRAPQFEREFREDDAERQLAAIESWIGHTRRHMADGNMRMASHAFLQIVPLADVVHTKLRDQATIESARQVVRTDDRAEAVRLADLAHDFEIAARGALERNDMDGHMRAGRRFHELADELVTRFGVEIRPTV